MKSSIAVIICVAFTIGCSSYNQQSRSAPPPPGPIQTSSNQPGVIPAGTQMAIRTNETISTRDAGQTYSALTASEIQTQDGKVLIPKGSPVQLAVVDVSDGGRLGTKSMELAIKSVTVNGRLYPVSTIAVTEKGEEGLGRNRRTAEMVGGGAVLGTVIGAIAGGGSGAAIGAAVGAAGGAAAQVLTRGEEIRVPAETVITFRLDQSIQLQGYSG